jgi:hypothetical protein
MSQLCHWSACASGPEWSLEVSKQAENNALCQFVTRSARQGEVLKIHRVGLHGKVTRKFLCPLTRVVIDEARRTFEEDIGRVLEDIELRHMLVVEFICSRATADSRCYGTTRSRL